jgi:aspartate aminotransferase
VPLREKLINEFELSRNISLSEKNLEDQVDIIISNGSKQAIYNALGTLIDPGDEVILFNPYWVSFPEMVRFWGGHSVPVRTLLYDSFIPDLDELREKISAKTKAIIINSPNNPAGIHYDDQWMQEFGKICMENPQISIISDEIYDKIFYYDPKPTYFYQKYPELLKRTIIINGISKSFCASGLRLGYALGSKEVINGMSVIQSQTSSGASHLIQKALVGYNFVQMEEYLIAVKNHLRRSSEILRESLRSNGLDHCWYQTKSAFYFMLDFSRTPRFQKKYQQHDYKDFSDTICKDILLDKKIALVPGSSFGLENSARLSLTSSLKLFEQAVEILCKYLVSEH